MECNKDEAVRAKEIAEHKLLKRDIAGARKFAVKAQTLFRELDGLSQFLEIMDVHIAHEKKINGITDYYGIFGVDPTTEEETLKKQYKRMALSLHPDKNKSVGAEGAFKIMSEAWSVLSDKDKRSAYDLALLRSSSQPASFATSSANYTPPGSYPLHRPTTVGTHTSQSYSSTSHPQHKCSPAAATVVKPNGTRSMKIPNFDPCSIHKFRRPPIPEFAARYNPSTPRPPFPNQSFPTRNPMASTTRLQRPETFWTLCNKCKVHYEYQKIYLNQNILCRRCKQPFIATAMPAPPLKHQSSQEIPGASPPVNSQSSKEIPAAAPPPSASRASQPPLPHPPKKSFKRSHEAAINTVRENNTLMKNNSSVPEKVETASASYIAPPRLNGEKPSKRRRKDRQKRDGSKERNQNWVYNNNTSTDVKGNFGAEQSTGAKELSPSNIRAMLMRKAKTEIHSQLNKWEKQKTNVSFLNAHVQYKSNIVHAPSNNSKTHPPAKNRQKSPPQESSPTSNDAIARAIPDDYVSMSVPDANFHNFDEDRIEKSFAQDQVWAAYDDDDGMPRYYAMVHRVLSRTPFKMEISWLNSKSNSEFGSLHWISSGFTKTTGNFRASKYLVSDRLNSFSHPVKWKKGSRGVIQILPTKGDVWALYSNWSADWNENTEDEMIHKYDLVVVHQDYNEDTGVLVAPLVKVAGFTSVFNQLSDQRGIRVIPREEMFRFSHQVPFYLLNGLEAENAPKNCYELDPAALPLQLLNVITEAEAAARMVAVKIDLNQRNRVENSKYIYTYCRRNKGKKLEGHVGHSKQ